MHIPGACGGVNISGPVVCHHVGGWQRNVHMAMEDLKKHGGIGLQRTPLKSIAVMLE